MICSGWVTLLVQLQSSSVLQRGSVLQWGGSAEDPDNLDGVDQQPLWTSS